MSINVENVTLALSEESETFATFWHKVNGNNPSGSESNTQKIQAFMADVIAEFSKTQPKDVCLCGCVPSFQEDSTYDDYAYKGVVSSEYITSEMLADVIFSHDDALSGNFSPICETANGELYIYAKANKEITIPVIRLIHR